MQSLIVFLGLFALICAAPLEQYIETDPELTAGYFEGDILLDETARNGIRNTAYRWSNKTVYYKIAIGVFDEEHLNHIFLAMRTIESVSCVRFVRGVPSTKYFITITGKSDGCYASVGFNKIANQQFNLAIYPIGTGCFSIGNVLHELLHTLGFYHMQSDSHRNEYVRIVTANIQAGKESNFVKYSSATVTDFGQQYDYAFSKNGVKTIVALQEIEEGVMGQRVGMSEKDIIKLNTMYNCPATTTTEATTIEATTTTESTTITEAITITDATTPLRA